MQVDPGMFRSNGASFHDGLVSINIRSSGTDSNRVRATQIYLTTQTLLEYVSCPASFATAAAVASSDRQNRTAQ